MLEIPHGIRRVSLHEDRAVRAVFQNGFPARDSCEECCPIDGLSLPVCCSKCRLAFAIGLDNLRRALLWRHNNLSFLLAEGESVDMQDGNCTQTYQLGFSILNSSYPLAEMLAFGEGSVCRLPNTGWEYYLKPSLPLNCRMIVLSRLSRFMRPANAPA